MQTMIEMRARRFDALHALLTGQAAPDASQWRKRPIGGFWRWRVVK